MVNVLSKKFSENGVPIKSWTLEKGDFIKSGPGEKGGFADLPDDPSLTPHSIIIDPLDYVNVQVWDRNEQEYRINKYDSNGSLFKILGKGNDPIFRAPSEIVIDSKDNVYVINLNNEIQKFTPTDSTLKDPTSTDRTLPAPCPFNTIRISFGICFVQNWNLSVLKTGSVEGIAVD